MIQALMSFVTTSTETKPSTNASPGSCLRTGDALSPQGDKAGGCRTGKRCFLPSHQMVVLLKGVIAGFWDSCWTSEESLSAMGPIPKASLWSSEAMEII